MKTRRRGASGTDPGHSVPSGGFVSEPSLAERATARLREMILHLELAPGARLDDRMISEQLGMSRTPVREAFNRLVVEGLVRMQGHRGAFTTPLNLSEVNELFDAYFLEQKVIGRYCNFSEPDLARDLRRINVEHARAQRLMDVDGIQRTNTAFHLRIAVSSGNPFLLPLSRRMQNHSQRLTYFIYAMEQRMKVDFDTEHERIQGDHELIVEAIEAGDRTTIENALTSHARQFHERVVRILSYCPGEFIDL